MVKKSLFWLYRATTIALWVFILMLLVTVAVLRYLVLPQIETYKTEIAQSLSRAIGQKISIGQIEAGWDGLNPHMNLREVTVFDKQNRAALSLHHIESSLSWWSIPLLEPRLSELTIYQPALTIRRAADGKLTVAGMAIGGASNSSFPNWLLHQAKINVLQATVLWQDEQRRAPALTLNNLNLRLDSPLWGSLLGQHRFALRATPSAGSSQPIDIRGKIYGHDIHQPQQWRGTLYGRLDGTDIAAWRNWVSYPFDLQQGLGATQFWLDFTKGQPVKIISDVSLRQVKLRLTRQASETALNKLSGRLIWTRFADGQQIQAQRLRILALGNINLQNGQFRLRERIAAGKSAVGKSQWEGEVQLDEVRLETLAAFVAQLPLPAEFLQKIAAIRPVGRLQKFALSWKGNQLLPQEYSLRSRFIGLGMQAQEDFPGFGLLDGSLDANARGGVLNLNAHKASLDIPKILRWPLLADKLSGKIQWSKRANGTLIDVKNLNIANPQLAGIINASYLHTGNHNDAIDLVGKFERLEGKSAYLYFPLSLRENTMNWLDNAFVDGSASDINIIVKGKLAAYPWIDNQQGLLQVKAKVTDGVLNYSKLWPRVEGAQAEVWLEGDRLQVNVGAGQLMGNQIIQAHVVIPHLKTLQKVTEVSAELQSPADSLLQFIKNSPLVTADDSFIGNLQASGSGKLSLDLIIPQGMAGVGSKVKGSYVLSNGQFSAGAQSPLVEQINGKLDFTETSLKAQNINARVLGSNMQFNLNSINSDLLRVSAKGQMSESAIRQVIARPLANRLQGNINWTGEFNLGKHQTSYSFKSSLTGFSSSLPPPFNKRAADILPLRFDRTPQGAQQDVLGFSLGQIASGKFLRNAQAGVMRIERGEINVGGNAELPAATGIQLKGVFADLDVDQWQALMGEPGKGESAIAINNIDLKVGALDWLGRRVNDLKLKATATTEGWQANVQSREIEGNVFWLGAGHGKVLGRLQSLVMPAATPAKLRDADFVVKKEPKYPALDIEAQTFSFNKKTLGRLELLANEQNGNWHIEQLRIINADSVLTADGDWQSWKLNPVTQIHFKYAISNVGNVLERMAYSNLIKDGEADFSGQLNWPGSPHTFDLQALNGDFKLEARKGQFLKVKSGFGRFLGIISLQSLPRRLMFDFRDVYNDGVSFDKIQANVSINHGVLHSEDFRLESPSALVEIKGETDLYKETQHLNIKATPHMSDTFSLAALAGGPAVAGAVFLAQKLFKDPLSKLAIERYEIVGTWDNPKEVKDGK